jgi:outer membrane lipoprotein carrier protein
MKYFGILSLLLFFQLQLNAQGYTKLENPSSCKEALKKQHKEMNSLKADFEETTYNSLLSTPQKGTGVLYFKKEASIRWESLTPQKKTILIHNKQVKFYENEKEIKSAGTKMIVKRVQELMVNLISGDFLNEKDFSIAYYGNASNYKLVLVPKQQKLKKYVQKIQLIFSKSSLLLEEMTLFSNDSDKVVYTFSKVKTNTTLADTLFTKYA